jgi:HAMP domain-containing protein
MMKNRTGLLTAMSTLVIAGWCSTSVAADCEAPLVRSLQDAGRRIESMQVTKPGQARVFAADGSEYTAGAVRRMKAEVQLADQACRRGDSRAASGYLDALSATIRPAAR